MNTELTIDDIRAILASETPSSGKARAGWSIDQLLLGQYLRELNVKLPVKIRYASGRNTYGTHYARKDYHRIVLNQTLSAERANETLWHELAHVVQSEEWSAKTGKCQTKFYKHEYADGVSYELKYYERQARQFAKDNKHIKLVR